MTAIEQNSTVGGAGGTDTSGALAEASHLLPVSYSIVVPQAILERTQALYPIEGPATCQLVRPARNDTYLVTHGADRYVARLYGAHWRSRSEILYELDLLDHLAARGVSVPVALAGREGARVHPLPAPEGTRHLVLFTYARGKALSWHTEQHCQLAGVAAATIHAASDDFVSSHARFHLDLPYLIDAPLAAVRPYLAHRPDDLDYLHAFAARVRTRTEAAVAAGLDWGVCHGDLGNKNVHVAEDGAWSVIDFDLAAPGWRAYDFVAAQWMAAYEKNFDIWDAFVRGYRTVRRFSAGNLAAVGLFHGISRLWTIGLCAGNVSRWGTMTMSDVYIDAHLQSLRDWDRWEARDHQPD